MFLTRFITILAHLYNLAGWLKMYLLLISDAYSLTLMKLIGMHAVCSCQYATPGMHVCHCK